MSTTNLTDATKDGRVSADRAAANGWPFTAGGPFYDRSTGADPVKSGRAYHEAWMAAYKARAAEIESAR